MKKRKKFVKLAHIGLPILFTTIICCLVFFGYQLITHKNHKTFLEKLEIGTYAHITNYAIYGIHMNIEGEFTLPENIENPKLLLANDQNMIEIPWEIKQTNNIYTFQTSHYINEGLNLENIPLGELYLVIEAEDQSNSQKSKKYYSVENHSAYQNMEYYTLTKNHKNYKITMDWNTFEECPTWRFQIKETSLPDNVYDITIDPGHDGTDPGKTICLLDDTLYDPDNTGCYNGGTKVEEREINLNISLALKQKLEALGYKVAMTRTDNTSRVEIYDPMGSATMANDTKSKFSLAIHSNSYGITEKDPLLQGLEIYVAANINFDLAEILVNEITSKANTIPSNKLKYQVMNGIYQRFFTQEEIDQDDYPETKSLDLIYYYYIREVGGVSTHAINNGYSSYPMNEHYNSNNTAEPYLFELGYVNNFIDNQNLRNNVEGYAEGIASAIQKYLENE